MSDLICITNRRLCRGDFYERLKQLASSNIKAVILREKDLSEEEYTALAEKAAKIFKNSGTKLILHTHVNSALKLGINAIHLPVPALIETKAEKLAQFKTLGASCHSIDEALTAQKLGCTYITASNIYETECKKGLKGKGLGFLKEISQAVIIPVYALGGITPENFKDVINSGAAGACVMSGFMTCENPKIYLKEFTE